MSWRLRSESLSLSASRCSASSRRSSRSSAACKIRHVLCSGQHAADNMLPRLRADMRAVVDALGPSARYLTPRAFDRDRLRRRSLHALRVVDDGKECVQILMGHRRDPQRRHGAAAGIGAAQRQGRAWTGSSRRRWWRVRTHSLRYCEHRSPASGVRSYVPLLRPPVPPGAAGTPDCGAALPGHISTLTKPD